jgi:hypothetical protein
VRIAAVALAALVAIPSAAAATFSFSITTTSPVTAPGVTLTGDDQTKTFTVVTQVVYTGSGNTAGWNIQSSQTQPQSGTRLIPYFKVTAGSFSCVGTCTTNPTNGVTYPVTLSGTAHKIYNAAANTGRGTINVTSTYQVSYPANAIAGTYSSTVTLAGATGP